MKASSALAAICLILPLAMLAIPAPSAGDLNRAEVEAIDGYFEYMPWYPSGGIEGKSVMGEPISVTAYITWPGSDGWVNLTIQVCDVETGTCDLPFNMPMVKAGDRYKATLNGPGLRDDFFYGSDVKFFPWAEDGTGASWNKDGTIATTLYLLPPVGAMELDSSISATIVHPGESIWASGSAVYNNTDDISGAFQTSMPQCSPLEVASAFAAFTGKTTMDADFNVSMVVAPDFGIQKLAVTISNATTAVSATDMYTVLVAPRTPLTAAFSSLGVAPASIYPGQPFWVNGTVAYNDSAPMAFSPVEVDVGFALANGITGHDGGFSLQFTAPFSHGAKSLTAKATNTTWAEWLGDPSFTVNAEGALNFNTLPAPAGADLLAMTADRLTIEADQSVRVNITARTLAGLQADVNWTVALATDSATGFFSLTPFGAPVTQAVLVNGSATVRYMDAGGWVNATLNATYGHPTTPLYCELPVEVMPVDATPPVARATVTPSNGFLPLDILCDGSASTDNRGIATYEWSVNLNGTVASSSAMAIHNLTLDDAGTYTVSLTVTDSRGLADVFTAQVVVESDQDGDGVVDREDAFPIDASACVDGDTDGAPDYWNAGMSEANSTTGLALDAFPGDGSQWADSDGDGFGDNASGDLPDLFPLDPAASADGDGDGHPEEWNANMTADDSTSVPPLTLDAFPGNATEWGDADSDGIGDNSDAFPDDIAASLDGDGDGHPDAWNDGMSSTDSTTGLTLDQYPEDKDRWDAPDEEEDAFPWGTVVIVAIVAVVILCAVGAALFLILGKGSE